MNIALFASAFHPHIGGVEELCRQLAHAFTAMGHPTVIVTNRWPPELPEDEEFENLRVYRFPMRLPAGTARERIKYWLTVSGIRRRIYRVLRRHDIELVHVQCVSANGFYALHSANSLGLPLVVTAQGERTMDAAQIYQRVPYMNRLLRNLLDEADAITACSQNAFDDLENFLGGPIGGQGRVVYNGIDLREFARTQVTPVRSSRPYILGIGRHVPQKGFDVLIRAFAKAGLAEHELVIAGEGMETASLRQLADQAGVGSRVRFPGRANRAAAVTLFHECEFFVLPSRHEPMGIVNLEAMAAGKAIIASAIGGVPEIVKDGENGLLFPAGDVDALAARLTRMSTSPLLRARLGEAGRRRAEEFNWDNIARQYLNLYSAVTASRPVRRPLK